MAKRDLGKLDWTPGDEAASLRTVYDYAVALAEEGEKWYDRRRKGKRYAGRILRVLALVLGAVAVVLPILAQIYTHDGKPPFSVAWASVALALAAALVALDRYFGFSSGWMRFVEAELQIKRLRHAFEHDWEIARASSAAVPELLKLTRQFVLAVDDVVAAETAAWTTEFRSSLATAEQSLEKAQK